MADPCIFAGPEEPREIVDALEAITEKGVSDYQFYGQGKSILIQRKACPQDFHASWCDGRLNRNELELIENIDRGGASYLLLEGHLTYDRAGFLIVNRRVSKLMDIQISGRLDSIQDAGIRLLLSSSVEGTVRVIANLYTRWQKEHIGERTRPGPRSLWGKARREQRVLHVIEGFDGIGSELAKVIWQVSGTARRFFNLDPEQMAIIPKLGPKRIAEINSILDMEMPERLKK